MRRSKSSDVLGHSLKSLLATIFALAALCASVGKMWAQSGPGGVVVQVVTISTQDAEAVLRRVKGVMARESKVPLRWPSYLGPGEIGAGHPLFVNLLSESATDYTMELGRSEECIGGAYCHYGTVRGNLASAAIEESGTPVKLDREISGRFTESKCNASNTRCNDETVSWIEGGYQYAVSLKEGKKDELIRMADSAIVSGNTEEHP